MRLEGLGNEVEKVVYNILFSARRDMGVWEDLGMDFEGWGIKSEGVGCVDLEDVMWGC